MLTRCKIKRLQHADGPDAGGGRSPGGNACSDALRLEAGFTLLELVLATLISSLVMGILASALTFSLRVWEREQHRKGSDAPSMIDLLKRQLTNVDPVNILFAGESVPLYEGEEHSIFFTTDLSVRAISKGAPVVVRYLYSPGERLLYYAEMPLDPYHPDTIEAFLKLQPDKDSKSGSLFYSVEMNSFSMTYEKAEKEDFGESDKKSIYPEAIVIAWSADQDSTPHFTVVRPNSFFPRLPKQGGLNDGSGPVE